MKRIVFITCLIAGLAPAATSAAAEEIKTKAQFVKQIAGKKLVQKDSWVVLSADGKVKGEGPAKGPIIGRWIWEGRYYCREITIDEVLFPRDCQVVTRNGDTVNFAHDQGKGITISWKIE
ncbi:MAG: hypothetical protein MPJ78_17460 [Hyphomicrobiaceae bacterium]|nr:hypothetical protein [Hyphomicrobiaceae bacterium]